MNILPRGVLQSHASIVSIINRLVDIAIIPLTLWLVSAIDNVPWLMSQTLVVTAATVVFQFTAGVSMFYISWRGGKVRQEVARLIMMWTLAFGVVAMADYFAGAFGRITPLLLAHWFVAAALAFICSRFCLRLILGYLRARGYNHRSVAIAGAGVLGLHLAEQLQNSPWMGLDIVGFYDDLEVGKRTVSGKEIDILGELEQLVGDARGGKIDRIYVTLPMRQEARIQEIVSQLADTTCSVMLVPDVFTFNLLHSRAQSINGVPVISIVDTPMEGVNQLVKRVEDILLSSLILLLISPILLGISLAVKATSPGPVFFKQRRYGIDGKAIQVWKFRSMTVMEDGDKVTQATKNDNRLTPIGGFLRGTSLDELPQFINVLQGQMSIVGPRPHAVAHNEQYRKLIHGYMLRHKVKPGITGWAQINGWRGETDTLNKMEKRIEFDLDYIRHWSLWLDIKIVFLTAFKGFISKNAY